MSLQTITQILQIVNTPIANPVAKPITFWDDLESDRKNKHEVDPLACSVAFHRTNSAYGLVNSKNDIIPDDFLKANQIRDYYSKKYFWNSLKAVRPQSEFRLSAMRLLAITESWELTDRDSGFFVKLPAFYNEDVVYDEFKVTLKTGRDQCEPNKSVTKKLVYLGKTFRWQKIKRESFWFKDEANKIYGYTTTHGHPFNAIFEDQIQTPRTFEFSHGVDRAGDMWYNNIGSFKILKD